MGEGMQSPQAPTAIIGSQPAVLGSNECLNVRMPGTCRNSSEAHVMERQGSQGGALQQQQRPVLDLLTAELWPQLHALCMAGASGRFLQASRMPATRAAVRLHSGCCHMLGPAALGVGPLIRGLAAGGVSAAAGAGKVLHSHPAGSWRHHLAAACQAAAAAVLHVL
jgi:hypothetical protein